MPRKCLLIYLMPDEYARFEKLASAEEREPSQQLRWILKRWLDERETESNSTELKDAP
jgi:hypothetical protein